MVHLNVYVLPATPVNADVGLLGVVTAPPAPLMMLHAPGPEKGVLAARVTDVPHTVWSGPALETLGLAVKVMTTSSVEAGHGEFDMVQRNV